MGGVKGRGVKERCASAAQVEKMKNECRQDVEGEQDAVPRTSQEGSRISQGLGGGREGTRGSWVIPGPGNQRAGSALAEGDRRAGPEKVKSLALDTLGEGFTRR